ncbi:MAG: hypothetical protein WAO02_07505 [Verrucomicrobiia bacterium]
MEWLNIHTSTLDSEDFLCSEPVDQATWLKLERYCIGQENGGVIRGAKVWIDRQWQHMVRATLKEVLRECRLWEWIGDDLKVKFYPAAKELEVQAKRRAAESTHAKRHAKQDAERGAEHDAEQSGKGREGKGREGEGNPPPTNRPSVEQAVEYFAKIGSDYTAREVRDVWNSFEATIQDDLWFFGRHPVGDWRSAMETRLSDNRKKTAPGNTASGHPSGWQEGDDDLWWTGELAFVEAAAAGAWIGQDKKNAARMDAIIAQRKGGH